MLQPSAFTFINPSTGNFANKHILKLVRQFSGHYHAIES